MRDGIDGLCAQVRKTVDEWSRKLRVILHDVHDRVGITAVAVVEMLDHRSRHPLRSSRWSESFVTAQLQSLGATTLSGSEEFVDGIDRVFGHLPVGGQFAAGHRDSSVRGRGNAVTTTEVCGSGGRF